MSCSCELVASSVLTMTMLPIAVLRVSVSLCSRSIDCTCWLLDPQIRVLMIISSAFVNLHSLIRTRILLRNASTISPFSALKFAACTLLSGNYSLEIHNSRIFPIKYPDFSPPLRLKETKLTQVRCLRHPNKSINSWPFPVPFPPSRVQKLSAAQTALNFLKAWAASEECQSILGTGKPASSAIGFPVCQVPVR